MKAKTGKEMTKKTKRFHIPLFVKQSVTLAWNWNLSSTIDHFEGIIDIAFIKRL